MELVKRGLLVAVCLWYSVLATAQPLVKGKTFTLEENAGLCSTILRFITLDVYSRNHGCEGAGYTTYGNYRLHGDTVVLEPSVTHPPLRLLHVDTMYSAGNTITLRFYDQDHNNITRDFRARFYAADDREYGVAYDTVQQALVSWKMPHLQLCLTTLEKMDDRQHRFYVEAPGAMTLEYTLEIPQLIRDLGLVNKQIHAGKEYLPERLLYTSKGLVSLDVIRYPMEKEVIFKDDSRKED